MKWIDIKEEEPKEGQIIVVWLAEQKEPACVRVEKDSEGYNLFIELVPVDRYCDREDVVTHWMPLEPFPETKKEDN